VSALAEFGLWMVPAGADVALDDEAGYHAHSVPDAQGVEADFAALRARGWAVSRTTLEQLRTRAATAVHGGFASPPGNARRFDEKQVLEVTRRFMLTLWNSYSFFVTYANIDQFKPGSAVDEQHLAELDRWILSELYQLIREVDSCLENYDPTEGGRKIEAFVDRLSNWYIRRNRRRFWKSGSDSDKLAAYNTLYECLVTVAKLLAPFTPFVAEELYQNLAAGNLAGAPESVHLADFPVCDESKINAQLSNDIRLAMDLSSLGRAVRSQAGIKVRQPLPVINFGFKSAGPAMDASFQKIEAQLLDELNVKEVKWGQSDDVSALEVQGCIIGNEGGVVCAVSKLIPDFLKDEGMAREIVHRVQTMRRSAGFDIADHIRMYYEGDDYLKGIMATAVLSDYVKQEILADDLAEGIPTEDVYSESFKLESHDVKLGVKKV